MGRVCLLHPFTPKAAGVIEEMVPEYHSQPHIRALRKLSKVTGLKCASYYFTERRRKYTTSIDEVTWEFYPVSFSLAGDHKKWQRQISDSCLREFDANSPDVTIINTSGNVGSFCIRLGELLRKREKKYVAMLGGRHYSFTAERAKYYRNASHLLVHSSMQRDKMLTEDMFKGLDIRVFPLGVDTNQFKPIGIPISNNRRPHLLFVGRISEMKGVHIAIETVSALCSNGFEDAHLTIIGNAVSLDYLSQLKRQVTNCNLNHAVDFVGHVEHKRLPSFYNSADLLLLPSQSESFGMVLVESMSCGVPVVAMRDSGGPDEIIKNGWNGILTDSGHFASDVLRIVNDPVALRIMKTNARDHVIFNYSDDITYEVLRRSVLACLI